MRSAVRLLSSRTIIFEVLDQNFHGALPPIATPDGRSRKSFAAYYHTVRFGDRRDALPHTTVYAPVFYQRKGSRLRKLIKDVTPPIVLRGLKSLLRPSRGVI
jgi:hypothetical protein